MHDMLDLQQRIANGLANIDIPERPQNLYAPIGYFMRLGGKRIRPLLTLMGADLFGAPDVERAVPAALAIELFHNFSLVHDDIMDKAPLRRGQQTVHEKWGADIAILAGDNLLIMAYGQLARSPAGKLPALLESFNTMATEVCEGQQLDMDYEGMDAIAIADYLHMIRLKTSVLLGTALKLGAILGDASEADAQYCYDFGVNVGLAFQLQDDILDVYGDPERFGKQRGGDILANKKTYLLLKALELADAGTEAELRGWLANDRDGDAKVDRVTEIYDLLGVRQATESAKRAYVSHAYDALASIARPDDSKRPLQTLAQSLMDRMQ